MTSPLDETHPIHGFPDPTHYEAARRTLEAVGYTADAYRSALGLEELTPPGRVEGETLAHRLRGDGPLEDVLRLFALGRPLKPDAVRSALPAPDLEAWLASGVLGEEEDGSIRAAVRLLPMPKGFDGYYIGDEPDHLRRPDFVMCPGFGAAFLARCLLPGEGREVLDMGTGNGFLALVAAATAARVTGVDLCPRAVPLARFNAALNGHSEPAVTFAAGDLFEPVAGRRFDRIVFNAPHVLAPARDRLYRDAGDFDRGIIWRFARGLPEHLAPGGVAQITAHWPLAEGESTAERVGSWFAGLECDVFVLVEKRWASEDYAREFIHDTEDLTDPSFPAEYARWLSAYDAAGIREIGTGMILARRRPGEACWLHVEDRPRVYPGAGEDLRRAFLRRDFLETHREDEALLEARPVAHPDLTLRTEAVVEGDGWAVRTQEVRRTSGLGYVADLSPVAIGLLARSNGSRTVRDLLVDLGRALDRDPAALAPPVLAAIRSLISMGFLEPNPVL